MTPGKKLREAAEEWWLKDGYSAITQIDAFLAGARWALGEASALAQRGANEMQLFQLLRTVGPELKQQHQFAYEQLLCCAEAIHKIGEK